MKRILTLLVVTFLVSTVSVMAEQSTLIDFSTLTTDYPQQNATQNAATMIDFSNVAGASFTQADKAAMRTSLAVQNWEVELASSSRSVENATLSMVQPAPVRQGASQYAGETVLGVRVHFPTEPFNSWAMVKPPFEIPAYSDKTTVDQNGDIVVPPDQQGLGDKFDNYGIVKNIGTLKSVSVDVYGLNFPENFSVILQDQNNQQQEIFLGNLKFDGWRKLTWENPNYISEVRDREIRQLPLYPNLSPYRKLIGLLFYRDASQVGGDFISYIKDIQVTYDQATLSTQSDINNEQVWGILEQREQQRRESELRKLGNLQVLRYLEQQKMDKSSLNQQQQGSTQGTGATSGSSGNAQGSSSSSSGSSSSGQ